MRKIEAFELDELIKYFGDVGFANEILQGLTEVGSDLGGIDVSPPNAVGDTEQDISDEW
jgi:hypothetical protein